MTDSISKGSFNQHLRGRSIDVAKAEEDTRLAGVDVAKADLDGDGEIAGESETSALFKEVDKFDRDGSYDSMRVTAADGYATPVAPKLEAIGDLANVDALRALANSGNRGPSPRRGNDDILMVGMNEGSSHEAAQLRQRGAKVTHIKDAAVDDTIEVGGRTFNLKEAGEVDDFVKTLDLPDAQSGKVADAIRSAGGDARDEVAQIAQAWAEGEKGGELPSRLVLSGHSVGNGVWGDGNGTVSLDTMGKLAEAMPQAARQVEDLHLSACYSGGKQGMERWRAVFPKAKTIWAYSGSAPGAYSGATAHQRRWEAATRGDKDSLSRDLAANTRKGENVAVWSEQLGYVDGRPPEALGTARGRVERGQSDFQQFFDGDRAVANTQSGPLREHYNDVQALLQHPDLPAADRPALEDKRDQTIRLIYYTKTVAPAFQSQHQDSIRRGFESVGLPAPDFSTLSRKEAMERVAAFEAKLGGLPDVPADARNLLPVLTEGLRDLRPSRIPDAWV